MDLDGGGAVDRPQLPAIADMVGELREALRAAIGRTMPDEWRAAYAATLHGFDNANSLCRSGRHEHRLADWSRIR